jgi:hypothetical protein
MIDNPKATPQQKVAGMFAFYAKHPELKAPGAVRQIISRTAVIQDDSGKPKYKTGYDSGVINTLYGKMNNEVEGMRQDLNKIQNGLGDRMMTHDFASRLHLTIAEGHNPGGIPANRFQLIMGNNEADIWYDKNQQAYQKVKNQFYKVLDDVNSESSGRATLSIYPKLRTSPADNALITIENTASVFRLNSNQSSWDITEAQIYGITFGAKEVL